MPALAAGEIQSCIARIRRLTDEPAIQAKYSDAVLVGLMNDAWAEVIGDLYAQAVAPPLASLAVQLVPGTQWYDLPASLGEVRRIVHMDSRGNLVWELVPDSLLAPVGPGIRFDGFRRFWVAPDVASLSPTIHIQYIPNGSLAMHVGQASKTGCTASSFVLAAPGSTILAGTFDNRPNAYQGACLSLLSQADNGLPAGHSVWPIQQRVIEQYAVASRTVTVAPNFDFNPGSLTGSGLITYEVYPMEAPIVWPVIGLHVARQLVSDENKSKRFQHLTVRLAEAKRACALRWASLETRKGPHINTLTVDNPDYMRGLYG